MSSTNAESFGVKLTYAGQMRRFPIAAGTSFKDLHDQVLALLALPKEAPVVLKYADEEGDLITISSDLELNSALVPGSLLRLTVLDRTPVERTISYPTLDAPMVDAAPTAPALPHQGEDFGYLGPAGAAGFAHPHPPPFGPYRGGLGYRGHHHHGHHGHHHGRGGFDHHGRGGFDHHGRGGFDHHGRGGHGHHGRGGFHGPYAPPMHRGDMSHEDWHKLKKERKEMMKGWKDAHKEAHKEAHRAMKKAHKERNGDFRCADGVAWGWANPGVQAPCEERLVARFARDVTIPDGTQLAPNAPFVKTWRLRNEGPAWPAGCVLLFLGKKSDKMGCSKTVPLPVEGPVATDTEIEVSVNLVAPEKPGRYTGYWKMSTPDGRKFGQRVWASIVVPGAASSSSSDSDREADKYEALVDAVLATGLDAKRHRVFRMLQKTKGDVNMVCEKLAKKEEKKTRKAMKKQMKI